MAKQTYKLTFEDRTGYVYAGIESENVNEAIALAYLKEIADLCRTQGVGKVMIYRDIPSMLTSGTLFHVARKFEEIMAGIKVAFVNPHANILHEMHFFVMLSTDSTANYQIFDNTADAEAWLLS